MIVMGIPSTDGVVGHKLAEYAHRKPNSNP